MEQWWSGFVFRAPREQETIAMTRVLTALKSLLALYGFGERVQRRRPAPVYIGHPRLKA
jgi:hypothetical protein